MASRKGGVGRWILISVVCLLLAAMVCCCGGGILLYLSPSLVLAWFVDDAPLDLPAVASNPGISQEVAQRLASDGAVRLSARELMELADPANTRELEAFQVILADDHFDVAMSFVADEDNDGFVNLRAGGELTMEQGWFTHLSFDTLTVGPLDLGQYIPGQELAADANRSLADQRAEKADVGAMLDEIERLEVTGGALELTLAPGAFERIVAMQR